MTVQHASNELMVSLVRAGHLATFEELPALVAKKADSAGLSQARIYLADHQQQVLREVTGEGIDAHRGGEDLLVDDSPAGQAYVTGVTVRMEDEQRYWVPVLDGAERLGVLHVSYPGDPDRSAMRDLASMVALLVIAKRSNSDAYARLIRTKPMSVSAEMQWTLMPPGTFADSRVTISAATEPAYDNAGDSFDYALDGETAHLAMFDAMGHDTAAGLIANLAVGAFRNERRKGTPLVDVCRGVEHTLIQEFVRTRFATAILAELNMATGELYWVNCGHLPPVLIRGEEVRDLECEPSHPLGMDLGLPVTVCREQLEPGDRLLLYTDGIIEARDSEGREFGVERFVDFVIRHQADNMPVPETLRRLVHAVLEYHHGRFGDDATVLFCEWHG
ncbi:MULTISPECIES: PP2C family protein-serine/threonine phosphatase [Nocardiopsis]|uniref:Protein serine/threonine phosphatase n=1 Tax=Nocardiopsis dassonvillei (strain ATCC 23218 / DSM 43111 / CIP 107115 / JCM 7437 / KCTC 9190 / NBRC 14626 / NCTC 10488 / NRRL B-5397 / IMRU 509) TaxID=446468 RepID=D7AUL3_NOCDD|nr:MULTISPECIES: PP2C family protein-serine/threonine phosphatase [Nocardiopsis]ADH67593.1 protein serine/threonine phosphatase [Nocardiopsis dassonvillei subsp. dassonvillei DSM 43111]APC35780.1 stage II sporulation protein E [Nocardiopsis dassonvillei]NKY77569.1 serine/threonine-protein phosphatase [Nocardiopsis dassonvillei]VEI87946.1 Phosphoserine phosphatase rsbU [Nocardiopsis dassonvillei]